MIDLDELEKMSHVGLKEVPPDRLADLLAAEPEGETAGRRLERWIARLGNPYCFKVGETPVRISFQPDGQALEKKLKSYFMGQKT